MTDREPHADAWAPMPWQRRRRVQIFAVTAALAVVSAVVGHVGGARTPEDAVEEYLRVLRSGDADLALEYVSDLDDFGKYSDDLLVDEAMAQDWEVAQISRRHGADEDPATVDVVIAAEDGTSRQGRFELEYAEGDWTILNPLIKLDLTYLPMRFADFNGVVSDAHQVWLFPGAYDAYTSVSDLVELGAPTYVATPVTREAEEEQVEQRYLPLITSGENLDAEVHRQLRTWIDECAESSDPRPEGCPFAARFEDDFEVHVNGESYVGVDEVSWDLDAYPTIRLDQGQSAFNARLKTPGQIRVSGEGDPVYYDGGVETFSAQCGFEFDGDFAATQVVLYPGGEFAFQTGDTFRSC
ncbi:MAG: hypothetical protein ACRDXX_07970 [Stackebrandtia sp.]